MEESLFAWLVRTGPVWPWIAMFIAGVFVADHLIRRYHENEWLRRRRDRDR